MNTSIHDGHLVPFPLPGPDLTGDEKLALDTRAYDEIAEGLPTYAPAETRCQGEDVHELRALYAQNIGAAVKRYLAAGLKVSPLPGRLAHLVWVVEDLAGRANGYDLPPSAVHDVLEETLPPWAHYLIVHAMSRAPYYPASIERMRIEGARIAAAEAKAKARAAMQVTREVAARKVEGATGLRLGVLVLRRGLSADRTKEHPLGIKFPLTETIGTDLALLPLEKWTGLKIAPLKGVGGDPSLEIVDPNEVLPASWTQSEITAATKANLRLPDAVSETIRAAREGARDRSEMQPGEGLDDSTVKGRAAIALAREWLTSHADMHTPSSGMGGTTEMRRFAMQMASIERLARGYALHVFTAADLWVTTRRAALKDIDTRGLLIKPESDDDARDYFTRIALKAYAGGTYLSPGELLPVVDESAGAEDDAWVNVIAPLLGGRDEVKADDLWLALRSAGITRASIISNLVSGRLTKTMTKLGWTKRILVIDHRAHKGYVRVSS